MARRSAKLHNDEFAASTIPGARLVRFERGGHLLLSVEQATIRTVSRSTSSIRYNRPIPGCLAALETFYCGRSGIMKSAYESTTDGGKTWLPGNHQVFRRA